MPEVLTHYPDSLLSVLKSAGAKCGEIISPHILTHCPPEHFCSLPQGEICVYGLQDALKMTQIHAADLASVFNQIPTIYSNINIIF